MNYIVDGLKVIENPIKDKPLTDFEQGKIVGKYKLLLEVKSLLEQQNN